MRTVDEWKAYIAGEADRLRREWAPSADRGPHQGGYNTAIPWPDHQPRWMWFDWLHNMYVVVVVDGRCYFVDDRDQFQMAAQCARDCEARHGQG